MKERTVLFWLGGLFVTIFFIIFVWQQVSFNWRDDSFRESIEKTMRYARAADWENAGKEAERVQKLWDSGNSVVAVKYGESDYSFLNIYLLRFNLAVQQRDMEEVVKEGAASIYLFENITSVAPKP
ncbi:MAG: DUF4363 family protein [Bacillota bacterium]